MDSSLIYYVIPDDGDDFEHPNVFPAPKGSQQNDGTLRLRLGDIVKAFPVPGTYHFRFKQAFEGTYVWLDMCDVSEMVPVYEGVVFAKVSRVSKPSQKSSSTSSTTPAPAETTAATGNLLHETPPSSPRKNAAEDKRNQPNPSTLSEDFASLLVDPIASQRTASPASHDPFDVFAAAPNPTPTKPMNMAPPRPSGPGGLNMPLHRANTPPMGMGIPMNQAGQANMMHMRPQQPQQQTTGVAGFADLRWDGMGTATPPRGPPNSMNASSQQRRPGW